MEKQVKSREIKEVCQRISGKAEEISDGAYKKTERMLDEYHKAIGKQYNRLLKSIKEYLPKEFINKVFDPSEAYTPSGEKCQGEGAFELDPSCCPKEPIKVDPQEDEVVFYAPEETPGSIKEELNKRAYRKETEDSVIKYWVRYKEIAEEVEIPEEIEEASDKLLEATKTIRNPHLPRLLKIFNEVSKENSDVIEKTAKNRESLEELL